VEAIREMIGSQLESQERALKEEPYLVAARSRLDSAAWEAEFAEGQAMTMEEAVEYALSEEQPTIPSSSIPEQPPPGKPASPLTRREKEVAALVAQGWTNRQIATELSISEHTVAAHVANIRKKLGLRSRSQLSDWVAKQRLASSELR
jgi:DNA-binding NarL/FixJ family response regulator